jgi:hypothetical protein
VKLYYIPNAWAPSTDTFHRSDGIHNIAVLVSIQYSSDKRRKKGMQMGCVHATAVFGCWNKTRSQKKTVYNEYKCPHLDRINANKEGESILAECIPPPHNKSRPPTTLPSISTLFCTNPHRTGADAYAHILATIIIALFKVWLMPGSLRVWEPWHSPPGDERRENFEESEILRVRKIWRSPNSEIYFFTVIRYKFSARRGRRVVTIKGSGNRARRFFW